MNRYSSYVLLLISLTLAFLGSTAYAANAEYKEHTLVYEQLCSSLDRPNIDCQCVAKSHATYAHLSPNQQYSEYLIEAYKERIGQPHQKEKAFERYANGRPMNEVRIEMYNAFSEHESADPFFEEVKGCVIPNAAKISLAPLPRAPIFSEVYAYRVNSTGTERLEQCQLVELERVLSADELSALHYVIYRGIDGAELTRKLNVSEEEGKVLATQAQQKLSNYEQNTLNIGNYCSALLVAEENSSGNIITRFVRNTKQRAGPPLGLEGIDVSGNRPAVEDKLGSEIASLKAEVDGIQARNANQPSVKKQIEENEDFQKAKALKNTPAANATSALLSKGCKGAGRTDVFCTCFVENFMSDIGGEGGAAALPVIQEGITNSETMALMQSVDQSRYMQDMSKAQSISLECEQAESQQAASQLSSVGGTAEQRYKAVCVFDDNASEKFCGCAAKHLASKISERELNILTNLEISQRQNENADIASLATDLGMSEMQLMQEMAMNPTLISASMGVMGACM